MKKNIVSFSLFVLIIIISSSTACDRCLHQSKAAYFTDESALQSGACSYGSLALGLNGGYLAAAVPSIYKQGAGCGACFQMRCKDTKLCSKQGMKFIVTDLNTHNETDFVLSTKAFSSMAQPGKEKHVLKLGITDVEYRRVPCDYKGKNLGIRVEESSKKPYYLSIKVFYQGGQTEIVAIDVAQVGTSNWNFLNRSHGAVWDTSRVPTGGLQFRFVVTAGYDGKYVWASKAVLPQDWKTGVIYDTGVQINDIAQEPCSPCDTGDWN